MRARLKIAQSDARTCAPPCGSSVSALGRAKIIKIRPKNTYPNTDHRFTLNAWSITTPEKKFRPGCPCRSMYSLMVSTCNTLAKSGIFIPALLGSIVYWGIRYICRYRFSIFGSLLGSNFLSSMCCIAVCDTRELHTRLSLGIHREA